MIESNRYTVFLILCICILASCARIGAPTGGPKDQTPPALQAEKSEANFQTNFSKRKFEFEFDEWIKLQNPIREVVVSPPTEYPVSVNERGKKIVFEFSENEVLKEDATYQINFGDAIKDFTEGNILKNFVFVFSTGDVIDSLSVKGKVKDVLTGAGEENILVVLYDDVSDTSFTTKKPFYFSKTDAEGNFELKNLRQDTFQIFALKDENVNYYYDLPREKVGFLDSLIITEELANQNIEIDLFDEEDPPRLVTYTQDKKGLIKANYSPMPQDFNVTFESNDTLKYFSEINKDTILIYHNVINSDSSLLFISYDDRIDTLKNKRSKTSFVSRALALDKKQNIKVAFNKGDSIDVLFNQAVVILDSALITLSDTIKNYKFKTIKANERHVSLWSDSIQLNKPYTLTFFPGAVTGWFGNANLDTILLTPKLNDPEQFGMITLSFSGAEEKKYSVDVLMNDKSVRQFDIFDEETIVLDKLKPGKYSLKMIEDLDGNGRWSPGNVKEKRHSEKIETLNLDDVKPNWDFELTVDLKEIFYGSSSE